MVIEIVSLYYKKGYVNNGIISSIQLYSIDLSIILFVE